MAASGPLMLLAALLLPQALSQTSSSNASTTTSSSLVLPSPVHSDVPPPPHPSSCTINSLTSPDVRLKSFFYQPDDAGSLYFTFLNRMTGSTTSCEGDGRDQITGDCFGSLPGSQFKYDSMTSTLTITQLWQCNDSPTTIKP